MIAKILELLTGKDDLERVAYKDDVGKLNAYLRTRRLLIPRKPKQFLDVTTSTQEQLIEMIHAETEGFAGQPFEPWVLEVDGRRRLPAFSGPKRVQAFSAKMMHDLGKVFSLGYVEMLLADITKDLDIDYVDLNAFSQKSWEIAVRKQP